MGVSKRQQDGKVTASDQTMPKTARTSEELGEVAAKSRGIRDETTADIDSVMRKVETSGGYSEGAISRQRFEKAKTVFVKTGAWVLWVGIPVFLVCWIYQLNSVTKPIERISTDVRHLAGEDEKLIKKTDALGEKLDGIAAPIAKIAGDIEHLSKEDERLNKKTEELEKQLDDIVKPMERIHSDIEELMQEDLRLNTDIEDLRKEVKKGTKTE